jgi:hypothetical protein
MNERIIGEYWWDDRSIRRKTCGLGTWPTKNLWLNSKLNTNNLSNGMALSNPFKHKFNIISTQEFISYVTENMVRLHY